MDVTAELWHTVIFKTDLLPEIATSDKLLSYGEQLKLGFIKNLNQIEKALEKYNAKFISREVEFEITNRILKLPPLKLLLGTQQIKVAVTVNPCIQGSPNSKIISIPTYDGELKQISLEKFFNNAKDLSSLVCEVVSEKYFNILLGIFSEKENTKGLSYSQIKDNKYHLYVFVIGSDDKSFRDVYRYSHDDEMIGKTIGNSGSLRESLNILEAVRLKSDQNRKYHWFTQVDGQDCGMFGYLSFVPEGRQEGNFVGITYGTPRNITRSLVQNLIRVL